MVAGENALAYHGDFLGLTQLEILNIHDFIDFWF